MRVWHAVLGEAVAIRLDCRGVHDGSRHAALLKRAQECRRIRDRLPNLVAVDFYRRGDVLGVVRVLNGLGS